MYEINKLPKAITLGYQGESLARTIEVDCADWLETHPAGTMAATILLPGYGGVAPLPVDMDGTVMRIPVTRGMTAKAGSGSINLRLLDGEVEKRSAVVPVHIQASHPPMSGEMPDPVQDWVADAASKLAEVVHFVDETIDATIAANAIAEQGRNDAYGLAESARDGLYETAEIARDGLYETAEIARDGLYETAEIARDGLFESAETTRNTQSGEATDRANAIAGTLEGIAPLWSKVDISVSALGEGAAPTASITQGETGTSISLGIPKGDTGAQGEQGPQGIQGIQGIQGLTGNGIKSILRTSGDGTPGTTDTYTITFDDDSTTVFPVYNGADGDISNIKVDGATKTKAAGVVDLTSDFARYALWRKTASGNPVSAYPVPESPLYPKVSLVATQEGSGDPSPENIRPIVPSMRAGDVLKAKRTGKNLFAVGTASNYINPSKISGTTASSITMLVQNEGTSFVWQNKLHPCKTNDVFQITFTIPTGGDVRGLCQLLDANMNILTTGCNGDYIVYYTGFQGTFGLTKFIITNENVAYVKFGLCSKKTATFINGTYITVSNIQLELGSTATPYEPYTETEITLTATQDLYGLPGGETYVDWDAGELVVWDNVLVLTGAESITENSKDGREYFNYDFSTDQALRPASDANIALAKTMQRSTHFAIDNPYSLTVNDCAWVYSTTSTNPSILRLRSSSNFMTAGECKAYLAAQYAAGTPVTIQYKLATPICIPLTDLPAIPALPQLNCITPRLNVLTASTGNIELTYAKSPIQESNEIRAAIALI